MAMETEGVVRSWNDEEGWGAIDSAETPGGCWAHFSGMAVSLHAGQAVSLAWEKGEQDGFSYRALHVRPRTTE